MRGYSVFTHLVDISSKSDKYGYLAPVGQDYFSVMRALASSIYDGILQSENRLQSMVSFLLLSIT